MNTLDKSVALIFGSILVFAVVGIMHDPELTAQPQAAAPIAPVAQTAPARQEWWLNWDGNDCKNGQHLPNEHAKSPAEQMEKVERGDISGTGARLEDLGDEVIVHVYGDFTLHSHYYRTEAACRKAVQEEAQEKVDAARALDQYR